ncbi:hypothetical protein BC628DRAFT_1419168 [Trametes gibbosa]|nr:hypothetical protein BC628DRAFT_1419168 [Trametes gibbosa]
MKLVVRVQYIGDRARILLREELAGEYTKGLIDDLSMFGFPMPHEQKPIEKSGFMLCVYHVDRDSDMHHAIQNAFAKAKSEAAFLIDRSIRYISLNEDGVMHTTNMTQKQYKPKSYKPIEPPSPPYQPPSYKQPYGKAPKYPSTISQARHAAGPLAQRMGGDHAGPSGYNSDYADHEMKYSKRSPRAGGDEGPSSMIDNTQQTLMQLSQSSAFQSLLQNSTPVSPVSIKPEPAPASDISMLLRQPASMPLPQTQIPNLQALLEKAGVRSSAAHAFLQNPQNQYHPASSNLSMGASPPMASSSNATPLFSPLSAPASSSSAPSQATGVGSSSAVAGSSILRSSTATPRVPTLRELWDIRREITALQARGRSVAAELRAAGQQIPLGPEDATPPSMTGGDTGSGADLLKTRELEAEIHGLRQQLARESERHKLTEATLRAQRALHTEVEDVKREMREPFVVPALLDAFMKIGQITDEERQEGAGPSSSIPMEY